jgi:sodium/bile acid cotransporter 7
VATLFLAPGYLKMTRPRFLPDNFTLTLVSVVILASFLPASGQVAVGFGWLTNLAIGL